jgi:hypothetical protein
MNILRDAAHLQTQLRLYDGLVDTRFLLLKLRPNLRQNWIGLALAYHLNGNLAEARRVLEQYERSLKVRGAAVALSYVLVFVYLLFLRTYRTTILNSQTCYSTTLKSWRIWVNWPRRLHFSMSMRSPGPL